MAFRDIFQGGACNVNDGASSG